MLERVEPLIIASAREHGVGDDDIIHAYNNPIRYEDLDDGFVMLIGPTRSANLIEVGFLDSERSPVIVHAMPARLHYLR